MDGQSIGVFVFLTGMVSVGLLSSSSLATESQLGQATWYSAGGITASGEPNVAGVLTGAHRTLPFGTKVQVVNLANNKSVIVRINDRGPFGRGRIVDVSRTAAEELGFVRAGVARVRLTVLPPDDTHPDAPSEKLSTDIAATTPQGPAPVPGSVAMRFQIAFEPAGWIELEMKKALEARLPPPLRPR